MAENEIERRTCIRFKIPGATVNYQRKSLLPKPGFVEEFCPIMDISRGGIRFLTQKVIKPDTEVTLLHAGTAAKMSDQTWKNPYITYKATKGYYHFWPEYSDDEMKNKKKIPFTIQVRHPKFKDMDVGIEVTVEQVKNSGMTHVVPIILLNAKEGADLDFLNED